MMFEYHNENFAKRLEFRTKTHENWAIAPHLHEFSEFIYVKSGVLCAYINGQKYEVGEKKCLLIMPNQIHEYTAEKPHVVRCAVFSNDFVPLFFEEVGNKVPENPIVVMENPESWISKVEKENNSLLSISSFLYTFLDTAIVSTEWIENEKKDSVLLCKIINYIADNFKSDIALKGIAKELGYHEKYISSELHKLTNMNFRTFLSAYRIDYAKKLLKDVNLNCTISHIAGECGFSSINTFNRAFKTLTGKTPGEYLRNGSLKL